MQARVAVNELKSNIDRKILLLRCIHHFKSDLTVMAICVFRVQNPHKIVCWHYICLNYSFEARSGNQAYRSGVGPLLSVVSVVVSGIGRGLVVQSGNWSAGRTGVGREERGLSVGASGIQRGYSGC